MRILIICLLFLVCQSATSQDKALINTQSENTLKLISSGFYVQEDIIISIGETVIGTIEFEEYSVSQGFLQRVESRETKNKELALKLFPNPSSNSINIIIPAGESANSFNYTIYDQTGEIFARGKIYAKEATLDISQLPSATYFIQIINTNKSFTQTNTFIKI